MFEVHPDAIRGDGDAGRWCVYETGDGGFDLVAVFSDRADAEQYAAWKEAADHSCASARWGRWFERN